MLHDPKMLWVWCGLPTPTDTSLETSAVVHLRLGKVFYFQCRRLAYAL